jgi:hypothetical protein
LCPRLRAGNPGVRDRAVGDSGLGAAKPGQFRGGAQAERARPGVDVAEIVGALRFIIATPSFTGQNILLDGGQRFLSLARDVQFIDPDRVRPGPNA